MLKMLLHYLQKIGKKKSPYGSYSFGKLATSSSDTELL